MLTIEKIRLLLKDMNINAVAQAAGVNHHTIRNLMQEGSNPSYATIKALSDYFEGKYNV